MKKMRRTKRWMKCLSVVCFLVLVACLTQSAFGGEKGLNQPPEGFVALFNGKDLTGWKGLLAKPYDNPIKRAKLSPEALAREQAKADKKWFLEKYHAKLLPTKSRIEADGWLEADDDQIAEMAARLREEEALREADYAE